MSHIAQDVLSSKTTGNCPPHVLAVEYTRHLLPWARRAVSYGRERRDDTRRQMKHGPRVA